MRTERLGARAVWRINSYTNCWKKSMRIWPRRTADRAVSIAMVYVRRRFIRKEPLREAALPFSVALFGHGRTIASGAAEKFARKCGTA